MEETPHEQTQGAGPPRPPAQDGPQDDQGENVHAKEPSRLRQLLAQGKVRVFILFVGLLVAVGSGITYSVVKGLETVAQARRASQVVLPIAFASYDLLSGMNQVAAMQRAHLLTGEITWDYARQSIWAEVIDKGIDTLQLRRQMVSRLAPETASAIDSVLLHLEEYRQLQGELAAEATAQFTAMGPAPSGSPQSAADSAEQLAYFQSRLALTENATDFIVRRSRPARDQILTHLVPLVVASSQEVKAQNQSIIERFRTTNTVLITILLVSMVLSLWGLRAVSRHLFGQVKTVTGLVKELATGQVGQQAKVPNSEMKELVQGYNDLQNSLRAAIDFAGDIEQGNYDTEFQPTGDADQLGHALASMRQRLKKVSEEEAQRRWMNEGLNKFANLLRQQDTTLEQLSLKVLSQLVDYISVQVGALYVAEERQDGTAQLRMVASFAYDRQKHHQTVIAPGEGIIGQVYLESKRQVLSDIPEEYLAISTGLGQAEPKVILVEPLINNGKVEGILELASIDAVPEQDQLFITELGESIAATLSAVRVNNTTKALLEESQLQAEQQRAQEEEMRQNMEEMAATQEEMARKQTEMDRMAEDYQKQIAQLKAENDQLRQGS